MEPISRPSVAGLPNPLVSQMWKLTDQFAVPDSIHPFELGPIKKCGPLHSHTDTAVTGMMKSSQVPEPTLGHWSG